MEQPLEHLHPKQRCYQFTEAISQDGMRGGVRVFTSWDGWEGISLRGVKADGEGDECRG
jgi:hypothetical protein